MNIPLPGGFIGFVNKEAFIDWFRGEFAAANAIIDAICAHLGQLGGGTDYRSVSHQIRLRRLHWRTVLQWQRWIPVIEMQEYCSIDNVTAELEKLAVGTGGGSSESLAGDEYFFSDHSSRNVYFTTDNLLQVPEEVGKDAIISWFRSEFAASNAIIDALCNHLQLRGGEVYGSLFHAIYFRRLHWKPLLDMQDYHYPVDGVIAELENVAALGETVVEAVPEDSGPEIDDSGSQKLHMLCSNHEECKFRQAQDRTFVVNEPVNGNMLNIVRGLKVYEDLFNRVETSKLIDFVNELRVKGNMSDIELIPALLQNVIDHLIQWKLIPTKRKPDGCIINFYDEGQYSYPFLKPRSLDQPLSMLLLSESIMEFAQSHTFSSDGRGNYRGSLTLPLREGSLLVMGRDSFDKGSHVVCSSPNRRVSISFFKRSSTRTDTDDNSLHSMLAPVGPVAVGLGGTSRGGTGVIEPGSGSLLFLPP